MLCRTQASRTGGMASCTHAMVRPDWTSSSTHVCSPGDDPQLATAVVQVWENQTSRTPARPSFPRAGPSSHPEYSPPEWGGVAVDKIAMSAKDGQDLSPACSGEHGVPSTVVIVASGESAGLTSRKPLVSNARWLVILVA